MERRKARPSGSLSSAPASRNGMATSQTVGQYRRTPQEQTVNAGRMAEFRSRAVLFAARRRPFRADDPERRRAAAVRRTASSDNDLESTMVSGAGRRQAGAP